MNVAQDGPSQAINQVTLTAGNSVATSAIDTTGILPNAAQRAAVTTVSAASGAAPVTADSIVSMYAANIATAVFNASAGPPAPLPPALGGVSATITDSSGKTAPIGLIVVTPNQVNAVLPASLATGEATIDLVSSTGVPITGEVSIVTVAPSLFTADESGHGIAAAQEVIAHPDGSQTFIGAIALCNSSGCTPSPISLGIGHRPGRPRVVWNRHPGRGRRSRSDGHRGQWAQATVMYAGPQGGGGAGSYLWPGSGKRSVAAQSGWSGHGKRLAHSRAAKRLTGNGGHPVIGALPVPYRIQVMPRPSTTINNRPAMAPAAIHAGRRRIGPA